MGRLSPASPLREVADTILHTHRLELGVATVFGAKVLLLHTNVVVDDLGRRVPEVLMDCRLWATRLISVYSCGSFETTRASECLYSFPGQKGASAQCGYCFEKYQTARLGTGDLESRYGTPPVLVLHDELIKQMPSL